MFATVISLLLMYFSFCPLPDKIRVPRGLVNFLIFVLFFHKRNTSLLSYWEMKPPINVPKSFSCLPFFFFFGPEKMGGVVSFNFPVLPNLSHRPSFNLMEFLGAGKWIFMNIEWQCQAISDLTPVCDDLRIVLGTFFLFVSSHHSDMADNSFIEEILSTSFFKFLFFFYLFILQLSVLLISISLQGVSLSVYGLLFLDIIFILNFSRISFICLFPFCPKP